MINRIALILLALVATASLSAQTVSVDTVFGKARSDKSALLVDRSSMYELAAEDIVDIPADDLYKTARGAMRGFAGDRDIYRALAYMKAAADKGNADAALEYSRMLVNPDYGIDDMATARYYEKNAMSIYELMGQNGNPIGYLRLGNIYSRNGLSHNRDDELARRHYERAASMGEMHSMRILGQQCLEAKQYARALDYLTPAAEMGEGFAQYELGKMYRDGRGVKRDREKAIYWLERAASGVYVICVDARRDLEALRK